MRWTVTSVIIIINNIIVIIAIIAIIILIICIGIPLAFIIESKAASQKNKKRPL